MPFKKRPPTTRDSNADKLWRVERFFAVAGAELVPNREAAKLIQVDEAMIRAYRKRCGIPALAVGSGLPKQPSKKRR